MKSNRILSGLAAVVLSNTALGYARHVAYADNPDRAIPAVGVSSPSADPSMPTAVGPEEAGDMGGARERQPVRRTGPAASWTL